MHRFIKKYVNTLFLGKRLYAGIAALILLFFISFFLPALLPMAILLLLIFCCFILADYALLFFQQNKIKAARSMAERFSNGDENEITLHLENEYAFTAQLTIIDEIPVQFQIRNKLFKISLSSRCKQAITYNLRPVTRGEYAFGFINVYAASPLNLVKRLYNLGIPVSIPVYPSFLQMRRYELLALSNYRSGSGIKKIRRIGHSLEFEQIKEYVPGDDYRSINWKATARKGQVMINNYIEEKLQTVYCVIDKGRIMKMPFEGMTLLDYSINASLALLNMALKKQDKAGIITYAEKVHQLLPADNKAVQMQKILEVLYHQQTRFPESDLEKVYLEMRQKVYQRSLIILFTNFESLSALQRQMAYLKSIARHHLLLVVFFKNTGLQELAIQPATNLESVYQKIIAEKFMYEKKMINKELRRHGILSILSSPAQLTVNTLNKYLELKARQVV